MSEYENFRRQVYEDDMVFLPVCPNCGRFVKADDSVIVNGLGDYVPQPNATCAHCGRVEMPFEGFCGPEEVAEVDGAVQAKDGG